MRRTINLLLATVVMVAVLCSGAWAAGPTYVTDDSSSPGPTWMPENSPYIVDGTVFISSRITVSGDVVLELRDGCILHVYEGINVSGDNSLTIECASMGSGILQANSAAYSHSAPIGGGSGEACGKITINGGNITVTSETDSAGIGGGGNGGSGGTIIINGGTVLATGGQFGGAGIGGGPGATEHGTLASDKNGSAWVVVDTVSADTRGSFSGMLMIGNYGKVYGSATVSSLAEIYAAQTLEIPAGATLTVYPGAKIENHGTINNDGVIELPAGMRVSDLSKLGGTLTGSGFVCIDGKWYDNDGTPRVLPTPTPAPSPAPAPPPAPDTPPSYTPGKHTGAIDRDMSDTLWDARVGGDMTIQIGVDYDQFAEVISLDGVPLSIDTTVSHDFGAREGSTIVTIWEHTLREHITSDGEHKAEVGFDDGSAIHTFTARGTGETPKTRRSSEGACAAGTAASVAIVGLAALKRRRR